MSDKAFRKLTTFTARRLKKGDYRALEGWLAILKNRKRPSLSALQVSMFNLKKVIFNSARPDKMDLILRIENAYLEACSDAERAAHQTLDLLQSLFSDIEAVKSPLTNVEVVRSKPSIKPHINIVTLGDNGAGKTTLTWVMDETFSDLSAISIFEATTQSYGETYRDEEVSIEARYETENRIYFNFDYPEHENYEKKLIVGLSQVDGAILVVSAIDGITPRTRDHILLARQICLPTLVVFISKIDLVEDEWSIDLVELEIRECLSAYGFPGDQIAVVRGSALAALESRNFEIGRDQIINLAEALDGNIPEPTLLENRPFLMLVDEVRPNVGGGVVVVGRIEAGTIVSGNAVEIVGLRKVRTANITSLETPQGETGQAKAGERIHALLLDITLDDVERGQVLAAPGSVKAHTEFTSRVYMPSDEEGDQGAIFTSKNHPSFYLHSENIDDFIEMSPIDQKALPGDEGAFHIKLSAPVAIAVGQRFGILKGGRTVGAGVVSRVMQ